MLYKTCPGVARPVAALSQDLGHRHLRRSARQDGIGDCVGLMVDNLQRAAVLDELPAGIEADCPNDTVLLAMAAAGEPEFPVTGDHRAGLLRRGHIGRTRIVTPSTFCEEAL